MSSKKHKEAATTASQPDPDLQAEYVSDIKQAQEVAEKAKAKAEQAASNMLQLYVNLLSICAKYAWNKIVQEQTASGPYTDLQGCSKEGPRGFLCKSFDVCMMFYLCLVFPNNVAEQERYYITSSRNPAGQRTLVCAACRIAHLLHCATTMLALQPQRQAQ
jgi:hypothetical protein